MWRSAVSRRLTHLSSTGSSRLAAPTSSLSNSWIRHASNKADKKKKGKTDKAEELSYFDRKAARKQVRTERYQLSLEKEEARKSRRDSAPKDVLKGEFRTWWQRREAREEIWDRQARQQNKSWKIQVAVVLERLPQVLPDQAEWEREQDELNAFLSQFGKEYPKEFVGIDPGTVAPITDEELLALLPEGLQPAPRVTAADESGKVDTLDRKLKDRVFFCVDGGFPTTAVQDDEGLLDAAKRVIQENGGKKLELYCASNAPMAVSLAKGEDEDSAVFGTKTFFMRIQHDEGNIKGKDLKGQEWAWLDRSEIVDQVQKASGDEEANFYRYLL